MLLDTSGLLCCFDADEQRHASAVEIYDHATSRLTHNYILAEFVALAQARGSPRSESLVFVEEFRIDPQVELVWVEQPIHNEAMKMLQSQLDKSYSLCDAVSFIRMKQRGILSALTTDHHFEQAGFQRLLP